METSDGQKCGDSIKLSRRIGKDYSSIQQTEEPQKATGKKIGEKIREKCQCSRECWATWCLSFFPFIQWMREYEWRSDFVNDVIAGLTIGIMSIPQGISYAGVAGVPAVYGLYSNMVPTMLYSFFGTSRLAAIGPPAVLCIMLGSSRRKNIPDSRNDLSPACFPMFSDSTNRTYAKYTDSMGTQMFENPDCFTSWQLVIAMTMLTGMILIGMGILHLGFVSEYLSDFMVGGFTSGAAVHVMTSQLDYIFGIHFPWHSGIGKLVFTYADLLSHVHEAIPVTLIMSITCIIVLMLIKELLNPEFQRAMGIPIPGELLVIILGTAISYFGHLDQSHHVETVHSISAGFPQPILPRFDLFKRVALDSLALALVLYSLSISLAKLYAKRNGYKIDANQEFFAYGIINVCGSMFQCFAAGQIVSRSIVYESSGAKSQFAGMIGSMLVLLTILWIAPLMAPLPKCILGSIIVVSCIQMLKQLKHLKPLYLTSKADFGIYLFTFLAVLILDVVEGLLASAIFAALLTLFRYLWVKLRKEDGSDQQKRPTVKIFRFDEPLDFNGAIRFIRLVHTTCGLDPDAVLAEESREETEKINLAIVIDCSSFHYIDSRGVRALKEVDEELKRRSIDLYFAECSGDNLETLHFAKFFNADRRSRLFDTIEEAVGAVRGTIRDDMACREEMKGSLSKADSTVDESRLSSGQNDDKIGDH